MLRVSRPDVHATIVTGSLRRWRAAQSVLLLSLSVFGASRLGAVGHLSGVTVARPRTDHVHRRELPAEIRLGDVRTLRAYAVSGVRQIAVIVVDFSDQRFLPGWHTANNIVFSSFTYYFHQNSGGMFAPRVVFFHQGGSSTGPLTGAEVPFRMPQPMAYYGADTVQRHAQLMFTSCGWFFDDVSGIETAQILMCADRALYLAESFTAEDLEIPFAAHLAAAQSNIAGLGTGTDIYYRTIKPARMSVEKVVHQFLMLTALKETVPRSELFYTYQIDLMEHHKKTKGKVFLFAGRVHTVSSITTETRAFFFALAYQGSYYFKCAVVPVSQTSDVLSLQNELLAAFDASPETIFQALEKLGGEHCYSLHDLLPEAKQAVLRLIIDKKITAYHDMLARAFDDNRETVEAALREGLIIPPEFKIAAEHTLSNRLEREIEQYGEQIGELEKRGIAKGILQQAHQFGYSLRTAHAEGILCRVLKQKIINLKQDVSRAAIEEIERFLAFIRELDLRIDLTDAQNLFYEALKNRVGDRPEKISGGSEDRQTIAQALANLAVNLGFSGEVCGVGRQK